MTEQTPTTEHPPEGMSRRTMIAGLGAATGAVGLASVALPSLATAAPAPSIGPLVAAITAPVAGLSYLVVDGTAFFSTTEGGRTYDPDFGMRHAVGSFAHAPLLLPTGSRIKQLNVMYIGQVIAFIDQRQDVAPFRSNLFNTGSTPLSLVPNSQSYDVDILLEHGKSYYLRFAADALPLVGPPQFLGSMGFGYIPPPSGFMPFTGATPRILDTRLAGGKVLPGDAGARVVDLGIVGAKSAVINLTADQTEAFGYFSVFPDGIPWPGNSSLNWSGAGVTIANTVIAPLSATGRIKLRAGESAAHAIIDVQGFLY